MFISTIWSRCYSVSPLFITDFPLVPSEQSVGRHFKAMQTSCTHQTFHLDLASVDASCLIQSLLRGFKITFQLHQDLLNPSHHSNSATSRSPLSSSFIIYSLLVTRIDFYFSVVFNSFLLLCPRFSQWADLRANSRPGPIGVGLLKRFLTVCHGEMFPVYLATSLAAGGIFHVGNGRC